MSLNHLRTNRVEASASPARFILSERAVFFETSEACGLSDASACNNDLCIASALACTSDMPALSCWSLGVNAIPKTDAGFVQLLVVGALATLGGLLTASLIAATQTSRQASALERLVRNETIGASGFQRLAAAIDDPADALEARALQGAVAAELANTAMSLRIEAEGSKIDVLAAELALVERYASQAGLDPRSTAVLLGDIGEARGRSDGAAALEAVRVAMGGLLPVGELDRDFTRFGTAGIDPSDASSRVLHAIPDLSPMDADRIAAAAPEDRAKDVHLSRYFSSGGRRFTLVTRVAWGPNEIAERRLPIEISTAGKVIVLAGPY